MTDASCPLCELKFLTTPDEHAMQACQPCANKIGLVPLPPARRPPSPCARCSNRRFLRVIPREHSSHGSQQFSQPMYLTHAPSVQSRWTGGEVSLETAQAGLGLLETYICRKCGAVEWYCADVERIPVHPHLMTEAIDYEGDTPYR